MAGGDQIDVVAPHGLQFEHGGGQCAGIGLQGQGIALADAIILAKTTTEIAASKKDGAGPTPADQGGFLAEMRTVTGYPGQGSGTASAGLAGQAVDPAAAGAQGTAGQYPPGTIGAPAEQATGMQGMAGLWAGRRLFPVALHRDEQGLESHGLGHGQ